MGSYYGCYSKCSLCVPFLLTPNNLTPPPPTSVVITMILLVTITDKRNQNKLKKKD